MLLRSILFIGMYPDNVNQYRNVFFRNLIYAIADSGVKCTVISPVPVTKYRYKTKEIPIETIDYSTNGKPIKVYYPRYASLSSKKLGVINTGVWSEKLFQKAAIGVVKKLDESFDAVYGHFFVSGGLAAIRIGKMINSPSFVAYGECNYESEVVKLYHNLENKDVDGLAGIISVSTHNANVIKEQNWYNNTPIIIAPNSVDLELFFRRDREECRKKLCLPSDKFIVGFVGGFIERKGDKRLLEAVNSIKDVYVAFAGRGENQPSGEKVLFCSALNHDDIPVFLNAVDVFCLPTQNEGSCNAIVEAASCGIPIISSDLPFNDDLLSDRNSIRINPNSVLEIRDAIIKLYENESLRQTLAETVYEDSKAFGIDARCKRILEFISQVVFQEER